MDHMLFADRHDAGKRLAVSLASYRDQDPVVLALPRGGVPVAFEVARALGAPLDLVLVRKIGHPLQPELAVGAVADGAHPETVINPMFAAPDMLPDSYVADESRRQLEEIERRRKAYLGGRRRVSVAGRTAIVIDDGIATGATMRAALRSVRHAAPKRLVLAVPVAPPETIEALRPEVDAVVCLAMPELFGAIGYFYEDFHQLDDTEVVRLLDEAEGPVPRAVSG